MAFFWGLVMVLLLAVGAFSLIRLVLSLLRKTQQHKKWSLLLLSCLILLILSVFGYQSTVPAAEQAEYRAASEKQQQQEMQSKREKEEQRKQQEMQAQQERLEKEEQSKLELAAIEETKKPITDYKIIKNDPPKSSPLDWAPGSKRQVTYRIVVPSGVSEYQVKALGETLLESKAKPLRNWNVAVFHFCIPGKEGSAFATGVYTKEGSVPKGNQVRPGHYDEFTWDWRFNTIY